ncbi:SpoIIE family protein phosphatase [Actinacidiphila sp. ITFR-21]|uniref:SpoIIE family protein phosphatase n=1 Tax=Actinacidiphila sp. ITFR-21 TaxID=3075199 RepID=UPI0028894EF0|nr:SpoIIE family protein phosphatase [Streptomyces sp. ITFR-21]WNI19928.1 SpoIIE family protein phosphatase [Streptomyces sp. ITFR-21]
MDDEDDSLPLRLRWVGDPGETADQAGLLRLALTQAIGDLGGLGGLAHLSGPQGSLRLAAVGGLPEAVTQPWEQLPADSATAPMRAVAASGVVWSAVWPGPPPTGGPVGVLSAPLTAADGTPVGTLSVLLAALPEEETRRRLSALAEAASAQLPAVRIWLSGASWWRDSDPRGLGRQMMREVQVGFWSWDTETGRIDYDQTTAGMLPLAGLDPATWDGQISGWLERIHPADLPGVQAAIETSFETGRPYAVVYRVVDRERRISWLELRAAFEEPGEGEPVRMTGTAWNVTEAHSREMWLGGVLEQNPDPIFVVDTGDRVEWANRAARDLTGLTAEEDVPAGRALWELAGQLRGQGLPELLDRARAAPAASHTATVTMRAVRAAGTAWYQVRAAEVGGYVAVQWTDITAQTMAEQEAAERARHLEDLNRALIQAPDTDGIAAAISTHVLPMVGADGLVLHDLTGHQPRLVAVTGHGDGFRAEMAAVPWPDRLEATALESGPQYVSSRDELARRWPHLLPLARLGGQRAWAVVPLIASHQVTGTAVLTWTRPRHLGAADRSVLGTAAVVIAHALRAAAAHERDRRRSDRLQRELLPGPPPELAAVTAAARYRTTTGSEGDVVGGHWYDLEPLPGGRVLAVIGSVTAGPDATVAMGILRQAVLLMSVQDLPPDELLAYVNDTMIRLGRRLGGGAVTATCLLAVYDPTTGRCAIASAGHPPPVLMRPGGIPAAVDMPTGDRLGEARVPAEVTELSLPPGSLLVLHAPATGDADPQDRPLTEIIASHQAASPLPPAVPDPPDGWLDRLCDTITRDLPGPDGTGDLALLTLLTRRLPTEHILEWDLPRHPESARAARDLAARALTGWGLADLVPAAEQIVSELVGNTVRHAVGLGQSADEDSRDGRDDIRLRLLNLRGGEVVCETYDGSKAAPQVRHPSFEDEFGRGLVMVSLYAASWGTRYTPSGKVVWAAVRAEGRE